MYKMGEVYATEEILGDHIYSKVGELTDTNVDIITGMLLECGQSKILEMLQNKEVLKSYVKVAELTISNNRTKELEDQKVSVLNDYEENDKDTLGEKLYDKILELVDSELMAAKITGMLLELDCDKLSKLLRSTRDLKEAVEKSRSVLETESSEELSPREIMAERIYTRVEIKYSNIAPQITGMLMELEDIILDKLVNSEELLDSKIDAAFSALQQNSY